MTDNNRNAADTQTVRAGAGDCAESRLLMSRRAMLGGLSAGLFSLAYMPRFAEAAGDNGPRLLIVVLRGGMDGINTVVPFGDSNYISMRGSLAIPAASTIQLDSFFGLHPALTNFGRSGTECGVLGRCVCLSQHLGRRSRGAAEALHELGDISGSL